MLLKAERGRKAEKRMGHRRRKPLPGVAPTLYDNRCLIPARDGGRPFHPERRVGPMLQPGQQLGPFTIEKELGTGAMGAVYRGVLSKTGQRVAIKIMLPGAESEQATRRFEREANILKQLTHPNIVKYYGASRHERMRYYAMEYLEGQSLDQILERRGRLSWEEVVILAQQLCAALQHAHEKGVVHRDLKP